MRREFQLGPDDVRVLNALGHSWELIICGAARWLLIHDYPIPSGYNCQVSRLAIRLDTYPPGRLDMAYFHPPLARQDGKTINNLSILQVDGLPFQQWSRHYSWRQGIDSLCSHIRRIRSWLTHEFRKR